jgi:hypothetical protein
LVGEWSRIFGLPLGLGLVCKNYGDSFFFIGKPFDDELSIAQKSLGVFIAEFMLMD